MSSLGSKAWGYRPEWSLFPRSWSLFRSTPALVPLLRLEWKDRSKYDFTKPRLYHEKHRPGTTLGPGSVVWFPWQCQAPTESWGDWAKHPEQVQIERVSPAVRRGESLYCPRKRRRASAYKVGMVAVIRGSRHVVSAFSCVDVKVRCWWNGSASSGITEPDSSRISTTTVKDTYKAHRGSKPEKTNRSDFHFFFSFSCNFNYCSS